MSDYNLSFEEIERTPLDILFDLEIIDSKITTAFEKQRGKKKSLNRKVFIEDLL